MSKNSENLPLECTSGFFTKEITNIGEEERKKGKKTKWNLVHDEIAVKKGIRYDPGEKKYVGFVTPLPGAPSLDPNTEGKLASKVLLLYLKGTDDKGEEKTIGYFYSGDLTSKGLCSVIKEALRLCHEAGVVILGTTCDGPTVNIAMLNELGTLLFHCIDFL